MTKTQVVYGTVPSKSNSYKISKNGGMYKSASLVAYENQFFIQCGAHLRNAMIDDYFEFFMDVYYPNQRADLDNSLKIVLDTLQKKVKAIVNDNKCTALHVQKYLDKSNPRVEFRIVPV